MNEDIKIEFEHIFRTSNSPDILFDTFRVALNNDITDPETYKILLRNKALSVDEISMFADTVCNKYPTTSYSIYFCVGQLLESISVYGKHNERAFNFFKKAAVSDLKNHTPYISIARLYNPELNVPSFEDIVEFIHDGLTLVEEKSKLYFTLANLYKTTGDGDKERLYFRLAEQYQHEGR